MSSSSKQVKRLYIQNFRGQRLPDDFEERNWAVLAGGVRSIFAGRLEGLSYESLYRTLYSKLYGECDAYAQTFAARLCQWMASSGNGGGASLEDSLAVLAFFDSLWVEYSHRIQIVCSVFLYLDRVYIITRPELAPIWDFAVALYTTHVMLAPAVRPFIGAALLACIDGGRLGRSSGGEAALQPARLIARTVAMLRELKVVEEWLHEDLLRDTHAFYAALAKEKLATMTIPQYLQMVRQHAQEEAAAHAAYGIDVRLANELVRRLKDALFVKHIDHIIALGLADLVANENVAVLSLLYALASESATLERIRDHWLAFIKGAGGAILNNAERDETAIVDELIRLKDVLDGIVGASFEGSRIFSEAIKEAFESFINSRERLPARLLATYADYQLRGGRSAAGGNREGPSAVELEAILNKIVVLFRFLHGKDAFEAFYKADLAQRLLLNRSLSMEAEVAFVERLREECGSAFTGRLESMFKDVESSKVISDEYKVLRRAQGQEAAAPSGEGARIRRQQQQQSATTGRSQPDGRDQMLPRSLISPPLLASAPSFTPWVVTSGLWPYPPLVQMTVPRALLQEEAAFEEYYEGANKGRHLVWHHGLSHCIVKARFPLGVWELHLSLAQSILLMHFNERDSATIDQVRRASGMDEALFAITFESLTCGKMPLLVRQGEEESSTLYTYNGEFTSKHHHIRIAPPHPAEGAASGPMGGGERAREAGQAVDGTHGLAGASGRETRSSAAGGARRPGGSMRAAPLPPGDGGRMQEGISERQHHIDAAIVRILKRAKQMGRGELIRSTADILQYALSPADFDSRIPALIEREFVSLRRASSGGSEEDVYLYVE